MCSLDCHVETINIYTDLCDSVPQQCSVLSCIHKYAQELCGDKGYKIITLPPLPSTPNEVQDTDAFSFKTWEDERADIASIVANKIHYMHHAEVFITSSLHLSNSGAVTYAIYQRQMPVLLLNMNASYAFTDTAERTRNTQSGVKDDDDDDDDDVMIDAVAALLVYKRKSNETAEECVAHFFSLYVDANDHNNNNDKNSIITIINSPHESNKCLQDNPVVSQNAQLLRWVYHDVQTANEYTENANSAQKADDKEEENQEEEEEKRFKQAINAGSEMSLQSSIFGCYRRAFENDSRCVQNQTTRNVALLAPDGYPLYWGVHTPHASSLLPPPLGTFELIQHKLQCKHKSQQEQQQQQQHEVLHKDVAESVGNMNKSVDHTSKDVNNDEMMSDNAVAASDKMSTQKNKSTVIDTSLLLDVLDIFSRYEHRGVLRMLLQRGYCVYLTTLHNVAYTQRVCREEEEEEEEEKENSSTSHNTIAAASAKANDDIVKCNNEVKETITKEKNNLRVFEEHWLEMPIPQDDKY